MIKENNGVSVIHITVIAVITIIIPTLVLPSNLTRIHVMQK